MRETELRLETTALRMDQCWEVPKLTHATPNDHDHDSQVPDQSCDVLKLSTHAARRRAADRLRDEVAKLSPGPITQREIPELR